MTRERRLPRLAGFPLTAFALLACLSARAEAPPAGARQDPARQRELAKQIEAALRAGEHGDCTKKITFSVKAGVVSRQQCVHDCFGTLTTAMVDVLDWAKGAIETDAKAKGLAHVKVPCKTGRCVISESGPAYGAHPGSDNCGSPLGSNMETQESMTFPVVAGKADELLAMVVQIH